MFAQVDNGARMGIRNTAQGYGWPARLIHWIMAATVFGMFGLGYWMRTLDYYDPWYQSAPALHKSIGILLIGLLVMRIIWRLANPQPLALGHSRLEHVAAAIVHLAFYGLLIALAAAGYLFATAEGKAIDVFGWFGVPSVIASKRLGDLAGVVHEWLAYTIIALAIVHILGAFKHHFIDRDDTLRRMVHGRARDVPSNRTPSTYKEI